MIDYNKTSPVFLLGAGRSGTKFVRSILSQSSEIDAIPFDVGYVWRYGNESVPHDELTPDMVNEKIIAYIRKTLPRLVDKKDQNTRYYLEKSVPNTLRPAFMHKVFPEARFIHLIRDGRAVTESSIRLWREPADRLYLMQKLKYFPWSNYRYAFWYIGNLIKGNLFAKRGQQIWGPRYKGMDDEALSLPLETVCSRQWRKCVEICYEQLLQIDQNQILEVRYEKLMSGTEELSRICDFLGISDKDAVISMFTSTVNATNLEKWKDRLNEDQLTIIVEEIGKTLIKFGYEA